MPTESTDIFLETFDKTPVSVFTEIFSESQSVLSAEKTTELNSERVTTLVSEKTTKKLTTTTKKTEISITNQPDVYYTEQDAIDIAKVLYRECGGVPSKTEQACVAWTILNSVDHNNSTIYSDIRVPNRYVFVENTPVRPDLLELSYDVLERWSREKRGETDVGRVLPKDYLYFVGDGKHNYFRNKFRGDYQVWDYSLESPYEN